LILVFFDQFLKTTDLVAPKAPIALKTNRSEPELGFILIALNMDVGWFIPVSRVTEKSIGANG
jgi:hypothetical protein